MSALGICPQSPPSRRAAACSHCGDGLSDDFNFFWIIFFYISKSCERLKWPSHSILGAPCWVRAWSGSESTHWPQALTRAPCLGPRMPRPVDRPAPVNQDPCHGSSLLSDPQWFRLRRWSHCSTRRSRSRFKSLLSQLDLQVQWRLGLASRRPSVPQPGRRRWHTDSDTVGLPSPTCLSTGKPEGHGTGRLWQRRVGSDPIRKIYYAKWNLTH